MTFPGNSGLGCRPRPHRATPPRLASVCSDVGVPPPTRNGTGRNPVPGAVRVFLQGGGIVRERDLSLLEKDDLLFRFCYAGTTRCPARRGHGPWPPDKAVGQIMDVLRFLIHAWLSMPHTHNTPPRSSRVETAADGVIHHAIVMPSCHSTTPLTTLKAERVRCVVRTVTRMRTSPCPTCRLTWIHGVVAAWAAVSSGHGL